MTERSQVPPDSDDVDVLLGAYVLDAVDEIERRRVERAAATDPAIEVEITRLRGTVDALADAMAVEPPAGLWESIHSDLAKTDHRNDDATLFTGRSSGDNDNGSGSNRTFFFAAAAIVVAVLISGATVAGLSRDATPTDSIATMTAMANDAATRPGTRSGVLTDADRSMEVRVIADVEGHGFVMTDALPALPTGETYQLWSAANGTMISLGMLGADPAMSLVPIDASVTELALTREPAQGSVSPTSSPMATGLLA